MKQVLLIVLLITATLGGCIFVPVIDGVSRSGITPSQRSAKLASTVKSFQDQVYWGDVDKAIEFAEPEDRNELLKALRRIPDTERVVEAKMMAADYTNDSYNADVTVRVKSFDKSTLKVIERDLAQKWVFQLGYGWKITELSQQPFDSYLEQS